MISELFYSIGDVLDYINNYMQFFILLFTIFATLFLFMLPYIRPLRSLLTGLGLYHSEIIRILLICYKSPRKYIRIYIELAIIKSQGMHQDAKWWKDLRRTFKKFIDDNDASGDYTIQIDTPFDLVTTEFNDSIKDYYNYFRQNKASGKFAIPTTEPISFITNLEVSEGYIVPITFITGLNDRYDEDWVKILGNYFTAFSDDLPPESAILPQELYFTYNWLMWGPSYQIKYANDTYKLIQYGFGDESNSVNVILKNREKGVEIWNTFSHDAETIGYKKFGYNCSIKGKLCDTSEYYTFCHEKVDHRCIPFLKRLTADHLGIPYLLELIDFDIKTNLKAENYFFSAYLWIMFGLSDAANPGFTPRKSLTFFEHANLADTENYNFLAHSLIDKCFRHFESIASHPEFKVRKYSFCLAMNSYIEKLFLEKLEVMKKGESGEWFKYNLSTSSPYSIGEILDTFDNYFIVKEASFRMGKVNMTDKITVKYLCNFYAETYLDVFASQKSALTLDRIFNLLKTTEGTFRFYFTLAVDESGQVPGGCAVFYLPQYRCGIVDSIAVSEAFRNQGIGKNLLNHSMQLIRNDAFINRNYSLDYLLAPVPLGNKEGSSVTKRRFWAVNGFQETGYEEPEFIWYYMPVREREDIKPGVEKLKAIAEFIYNVKAG